MCDPVSLGVGTAVAGGVKAVSGFQAKKQQASLANKQALDRYKTAELGRQLDYRGRLNTYNQKIAQYEESGRAAVEALGRGYGQSQAQLNDVYRSVDFSTQANLINKQQQVGRARARGVSGQSAQLAAQNALAQYGRNQAILSQNLLGAQNRFAYDTENLRRRYMSNRNAAYGRIGQAPIAGMPIPEPQFNRGPSYLGLAADLGQAALSGYSTYNSLKAPKTGLEGAPEPEVPEPEVPTEAPGGYEISPEAVPIEVIPYQP